MNSTRFFLGLRQGSLLTSAILLAALSSGCRESEAAVEQAPEVKISVETSEVTALDAPRILRLTGVLRGAKETELAANVSGRILKTNVERGQEVQEGTILAQVDVRAAALSLAEARVQVETSKTQQEINQADCQRYEQLKARNAVTDLEYDQVTAKCKTAPLSVEAAKARQSIAAKNVGDGVIRSPFSGVITDRFVEVGEFVQASSRVVSIAQIEGLKLEFSIPEANWPQVKKDAEVRFRVAAYGDQIFSGKVVHIAGAVRDTRDVLVEAWVDNQEKKLLPGMFTDVELTIGTQSLPSLPLTAVFEQNGKKNVLVKNNGILEQRVLQLLPEYQGRFPILKGVNVGEQVVTTHSPELQNGQRVN